MQGRGPGYLPLVTRAQFPPQGWARWDGEGTGGEAVGGEESLVEARGEKEAAGDQSWTRHLLRDHLFDLRLHVSVHCFGCRGSGWGGVGAGRGDGDENQSHWELPGE